MLEEWKILQDHEKTYSFKQELYKINVPSKSTSRLSLDKESQGSLTVITYTVERMVIEKRSL